MIRRTAIAAATLTAVLVTAAVAVVVRVDVIPGPTKGPPQPVTAEAKARAGGLVDYTVTYRPAAARYLVASLSVRKEDALVAETHFPAYVREKVATYYFTVAADCVAGSAFEVSERTFGGTDENPIPLPGGIDYALSLKSFPPGADAPRRGE